MTDSHPTSSGPTIEPAWLIGVVVALVIGPFTIALGAVLAEITVERRIWLWVAALPSLGVAWLLWPLTHRHLLAAGVALRHTHAHHDPGRLLAAVWPHLWPAWVAMLTLAPVIAGLIALVRQPSFPETRNVEDRSDPGPNRRLERRAAKRAQAHSDRTGDKTGIFVGYKLGGDDLLPTRRGRVMLPLPRLAHHLLVTGATGSGKTETVLRLAYSLASTSDWKVVYLDGKGDRQTMERFAALMTHAGRGASLFPDERYNGWLGTQEEIANRLLQLVDFAQDGGGTYYRDLAVNAIHLACHTPIGPPRSTTELLQRLSPAALAELHNGRPDAGHAASLRAADLEGIRARYAAFFMTVGNVLDGKLGFEQIDTGYFLLDGLRLKYEAGYLARFLVEEFTQWAVARKPRNQHVLLIVDEFSAIATAGNALVDVVERARGFGVAAALCPQVAEGMGGEEATARIIGSTKTILLHQTAIPSQLIDVAGTRRVYEYGHQLNQQTPTGLGSARLQHQYRVDPNHVRRLQVGQCYAISPGHAMKLQISPAPTEESLKHEAPQSDD